MYFLGKVAMRPKMLLALCCTIFWTTATFAQFNKSEKYFQTHYGGPVHAQQESDGSKSLFYLDEPYFIGITFINGESAALAYGKTEGQGKASRQVSLQDKDIKLFLEQYREGHQWKPVDMGKLKKSPPKFIPGASRMWERSDRKLLANYQVESQMLFFKKPVLATSEKEQISGKDFIAQLRLEFVKQRAAYNDRKPVDKQWFNYLSWHYMNHRNQLDVQKKSGNIGKDLKKKTLMLLREMEKVVLRMKNTKSLKWIQEDIALVEEY